MQSIESYQDALQYVQQWIPSGHQQSFPGEIGWQRTVAIMEALGNPQEQMRVIHIAGTSGKGSVATMASEILHALELPVGLTVSPHLSTIRERFVVNGSMITKDEFCSIVRSIAPVIETFRGGKYGDPTFFDLCVAIAFSFFVSKEVQYAVVETGLGGLLDGTNCVKRSDKICVITPIGFDHMAVLGQTLPEIAEQKAGIIRPGNIVRVVAQDSAVADVFRKAAAKQSAELDFVSIDDVITSRLETDDGQIISLSDDAPLGSISALQLGVHGLHQAQNLLMALAGVKAVIKTASSLQYTDAQLEEAIRQSMKNIQIRGRGETLKDAHGTIILDVAHNPQKMAAFCADLRERFGEELPTSCVVAFKHGKDAEKMLRQLAPLVCELFITSFEHTGNDLVHTSIDPDILHRLAIDAGIINCIIEPDLTQAITRLRQKKGLRIITGSIYLISEVFRQGLIQTKVDTE